MPVRENGVADCSLLGGENAREVLGPDWLAFAGVNEEPLWTSAEEVGVCSCRQGEWLEMTLEGSGFMHGIDERRTLEGELDVEYSIR